MKPVTVEFTPMESLTLVGILAGYVKAREKRGLSVAVTKRIHDKVDKALLSATEPEHVHLGEPS